MFFWQALGRCFDAVPALELRRGELFDFVKEFEQLAPLSRDYIELRRNVRETAREVVDDMM